jgi:hypothetical protein
MRSRRRRTGRTHQANTGSSTSLLATACSASLIGLDSFESFKGSQLVELSFHSTSCKSHPWVVRRSCARPLFVIFDASSLDKAFPFSDDLRSQTRWNSCVLQHRLGREDSLKSSLLCRPHLSRQGIQPHAGTSRVMDSVSVVLAALDRCFEEIPTAWEQDFCCERLIASFGC